MKKSFLIPILLSLSTFSIAQENLSKNFSYEQPKLNFTKKPIFKKEQFKNIKPLIVYNKYALKDLGINEEQFNIHIKHFLNYTYDFLDEKEVTGPLLIGFSLKAVKPKDSDVICEHEPKKCSLNSIEIVFDKPYLKYTEELSKYVINKLDKNSSNEDITKDYSEPIISNFNYIGEMNAAILVDLTPTEFKNEQNIELFNKLIKNIDDLIYPDGEETAKKYSDMQKEYFKIENKKEQNSLRSKEPLTEKERHLLEQQLDLEEQQNEIYQLNKKNSHIEQSPLKIEQKNDNVEKTNNKSYETSSFLSDEEKKVQQDFNQLRQKMFPLPTATKKGKSVDFI